MGLWTIRDLGGMWARTSAYSEAALPLLRRRTALAEAGGAELGGWIGLTMNLASAQVGVYAPPHIPWLQRELSTD